MMATQRRTAVALSGLALLVVALIANGCGSIFETNQAACRRWSNRILSCASAFTDVAPGSGPLVAQFCETVPDKSECQDWSVFADAVTSVSCTQLITSPEIVMNLNNIAIRLIDNGCFPGLTGGAGSSDSASENSSCEPLTDFELCRLDNSCPEDCPK